MCIFLKDSVEKLKTAIYHSRQVIQLISGCWSETLILGKTDWARGIKWENLFKVSIANTVPSSSVRLIICEVKHFLVITSLKIWEIPCNLWPCVYCKMHILLVHMSVYFLDQNVVQNIHGDFLVQIDQSHESSLSHSKFLLSAWPRPSTPTAHPIQIH